MMAKSSPATVARPTSAGREAECHVLYVHPNKQGIVSGKGRERFGNPYLFIPVGVVGLANLLRAQGLSVRGLNYPLELLLDPSFRLQDWLDRHKNARLILIDLHWYEHAYGAIQVAKLCRRTHPRAWVVLGGLTASAFAEEILVSHPAVDLIIRGDAEWPLLDLVEALGNASRGDAVDLSIVSNLTYRRGDEIVSNPLDYCANPRHLDTLNFVDLSFLEHAEEYHERQFSGLLPLKGHWLCIGRGCRHECSFCGGGRQAQHRLAGRQEVVVRSVDRVLRDVESLWEKGIHQVAFNLDLAQLGREYWSALFGGMVEKGVHIGIYNEFWGLPPDGFLSAMVEAIDARASRLAFSPLSGSETVRRLNGKRFSNKAFLDVLRALREHGLLVMVYFSLNLPGEDEDAFVETLALAEQIHEIYPASMLDILNMCHTLDPISPMSGDPDRYGVQVRASTFQNYYDYGARTRWMGPGARCGKRRLFWTGERDARRLAQMADRWDRTAAERGQGWHPIPETW